MIFHLRIKSNQLKYDKKHVPVMQLRITLRLLTGDHLIGCISEEALQAAEERIVITGAYLSYELPLPGSGNLAGRYQIQDRNP